MGIVSIMKTLPLRLTQHQYVAASAFGLIYEGAIGQPRLTTSLYDHLGTYNYLTVNN
jgi:hypothetical protein